MSLVLTGTMFWLYTQQLTCDAGGSGCLVNVSVHPEDRFAAQYDPGKPQDSVVIVGIDDATVKSIGQYPLSREKYSLALASLENAGAQVVAFDIGFSDPRDQISDTNFAHALATATVPVVLAYGAGQTQVKGGKVVQEGIDQIPYKEFRCADANTSPNVACARPYPNVVLASTDLLLDRDGVVRRIPLAVQPACYADAACGTPTIDTFGFAAYRAFQLGTDFKTGPDVVIANGTARFGQAWSTPADGSGSILVNYSGPPGNFDKYGHYLSFANVFSGNFDPNMV